MGAHDTRPDVSVPSRKDGHPEGIIIDLDINFLDLVAGATGMVKGTRGQQWFTTCKYVIRPNIRLCFDKQNVSF
jgi:hypothetical protein